MQLSKGMIGGDTAGAVVVGAVVVLIGRQEQSDWTLWPLTFLKKSPAKKFCCCLSAVSKKPTTKSLETWRTSQMPWLGDHWQMNLKPGGAKHLEQSGFQPDEKVMPQSEQGWVHLVVVVVGTVVVTNLVVEEVVAPVVVVTQAKEHWKLDWQVPVQPGAARDWQAAWSPEYRHPGALQRGW
jgi:hypothetical protein